MSHEPDTIIKMIPVVPSSSSSSTQQQEPPPPSRPASIHARMMSYDVTTVNADAFDSLYTTRNKTKSKEQQQQRFVQDPSMDHSMMKEQEAIDTDHRYDSKNKKNHQQDDDDEEDDQDDDEAKLSSSSSAVIRSTNHHYFENPRHPLPLRPPPPPVAAVAAAPPQRLSSPPPPTTTSISPLMDLYRKQGGEDNVIPMTTTTTNEATTMMTTTHSLSTTTTTPLTTITTATTTVTTMAPSTEEAVTDTPTTTKINNNNPAAVAASSSSSDSTKKNKNNHNNNNDTKKYPPEALLPIPATRPSSSSEEMIHRIRLGVCAMDKKAKSKPMAEILSRFDPHLYHVIFFSDDIILHQCITSWPICDVIIAFFSKGYPLQKVKEYVSLRKPLVLNDLEKQLILQDRRKVYDMLEAAGIDVPRHIYVSRDGYVSTGTGDGNNNNKHHTPTNNNNNNTNQQQQQYHDTNCHMMMEKKPSNDETITTTEDDDTNNNPQPSTKKEKEHYRNHDEFLEFDDHIEYHGVSIHKPFVEKPADAEDHNICIYYPTSAGGGCKKLFRKIGNRSSEFYPNINEVRRDGGSYIYEEFVETQGTDVKMYSVGPEYGHAEARKSPTVDGKVERNSDGKEVRFPVILTFREKEIARRIVLVFKQFVCGFDILRVQEGHSVISYVCDVNGWSFVKNSRKYYDDCAQVLSEHIICAVKPAAHRAFSTLDPLVTTSLNRDGGESFARAARFMVRQQQQQRIKDRHHDDIIMQRRKSITLPKEEHKHQRLRSSSLSESNLSMSGMTEQQQRSRREDGEEMSDIISMELTTKGTGEEATTLLIDGALPVREFPDNLTSNPPPISKYSTDSFGKNDSIPYLEDISIPQQQQPGLDLNQMENRSIGGTSSDNDSNYDINHSSSNNKMINDVTNSFVMNTHQEELRCVIAIVRHGDRTPKQKIKINTSEPHILCFFHEHSEDCRKDLKVKSKASLTEFLEIVKSTLSQLPKEPITADSVRYQLLHVRDILERWKIVGLNRKLQFKPRKFVDVVDESTKETKARCKEVQVILKWGGNLTKLGEKQSIQLGRRFRHAMYPDVAGGGILRLHSTFRHDLKIKTSDEGRVMKTAAAFAKGLLELEGDLPPILVSLVHKEKGSMHMLDQSGNQEVKAELDECKEKITANLQRDIDVMTATEDDLEQLVGPKELSSFRRALMELGNPRKALIKIHETMKVLLSQLDDMVGGLTSGEELRNKEQGEGIRTDGDADLVLSGVKLYKGETLLELTERWRFIYDRLYDESTDKFDLSRIPDVHDNVRFDMLHNPHLGLTKTLQRLYELAKAFADCVVPQEYGTTIKEKRSVGVKICHSLLEKVKYDLNVARTDNEVDMRYMINMEYAADLQINTMGRRIRTRLYFTSESHLHTVLNVLRFGLPCGDDDVDGTGISNTSRKPLLSEQGMKILNETPELCYLTHIVLRVFEDSRSEMANDPHRFRVEILFSPGAHHTPLHMNELDRDHDASRFDTAPLEVIGRDSLTCEEIEEFFEKVVAEGQE